MASSIMWSLDQHEAELSISQFGAECALAMTMMLVSICSWSVHSPFAPFAILVHTDEGTAKITPHTKVSRNRRCWCIWHTKLTTFLPTNMAGIHTPSAHSIGTRTLFFSATTANYEHDAFQTRFPCYSSSLFPVPCILLPLWLRTSKQQCRLSRVHHTDDGQLEDLPLQLHKIRK